MTLSLIISLGVCILYFFSGTLFFHFVESMNGWDSLYWSFILNAQTGSLQYLFKDSSQNISTIAGRVFVMIYILLGMIVVGFTFAYLAQLIFDKQEEFLRSRANITRKNLVLIKMVILAVLYLFCWILGGLVYTFGEGWGWIDSFYFSFITAAGIGETDLAPSQTWTKVIATFLVFLTSFMFTFGLATLADYIAEVQKDEISQKHFRMRLSVMQLKEMDRNHDGRVTEQEFLEYMLVACEMCSQDDIDHIKGKFQALDQDESGNLDLGDMNEKTPLKL